MEFEAQPDHRMEYTDNPERARINKRPRLRSIRVCGIGSGVQIVKARVSAKMGAIMNIEMEDVRGRNGSLVNSLMASANG